MSKSKALKEFKQIPSRPKLIEMVELERFEISGKMIVEFCKKCTHISIEEWAMQRRAKLLFMVPIMLSILVGPAVASSSSASAESSRLLNEVPNPFNESDIESGRQNAAQVNVPHTIRLHTSASQPLHIQMHNGLREEMGQYYRTWTAVGKNMPYVTAFFMISCMVYWFRK